VGGQKGLQAGAHQGRTGLQGLTQSGGDHSGHLCCGLRGVDMRALGRAPQISPINIRPNFFTSDRPAAFSLELDAKRLTQGLPDGDGFPEIADAGAAAFRKLVALGDGQGRQVGED